LFCKAAMAKQRSREIPNTDQHRSPLSVQPEFLANRSG